MDRDWTPEERIRIALGLDALECMMKEWGDTKASLADCLGTTRQNVSQIFKMAQSFTLKQVRTIAQRYEMTPEQICECFALLPDTDHKIQF